MFYLLLIPLATYAALSVLTHENHARGDAGRLLSGFLLCLTIATAGDIVLSTTPDLTTATIGAALRLAGNATASLLLPLIPLALAYGRLPRAGKHALWWLAAGDGILLTAILALMARSPQALLVPTESGGYLLAHPNTHPAVMTDSLATATSYLLTTGVTLLLMHGGHIVRPMEGWLMLAALLVGLLTRLLNHSLGQWVSPFLLAGVFAYLLAVYRRMRPLRETLRALYAEQVDGLLVLDEEAHAVWLNDEASRTLGAVLDGPRLNPALLLAAKPYASIWNWLESLPSSKAVREFETTNDDTQHVLCVCVELLPRLAALPGGRVVRLMETTAPGLRDHQPVHAAGPDPTSSIAQTLSSEPNTEATLAQTLNTVLQVTGLDAALVYLRHSHNPDLLHLAGTYSVQGATLDAPQTTDVRDSFVGAAVLRGKPVMLGDLTNQGGEPPHNDAIQKEGIQAGLAVPLVARGHVLGALAFLGRHPHKFAQNEVLLLESVGHQLGAAYDSADLYSAEYRQRVQAEVLNEVVVAMGSVTSLGDVLEAVLEQLPRIIDYDSASIMLFSDEDATVRAWRGFAHPDRLTESTPLVEVPVFQYLREHKKPLRITDTHRHPLWRTDILDGPRIRSTINAPLIVRDECIGALTVDSCQVNHYGEEDARVVQNLANHLAMAVENTRLLNETQQRNEMLAALNSLTAATSASLELGELLATALETVSELTGLESGDIYLRDETGQQLLLRASHDLPNNIAMRVETIGYGKGLLGQVWKTGQPIVTDDYRADPRRLSDDFDIQTHVGVPLVAKGEVIGSLAVFDRRKQPITDEDLELMVSIGQQLGVAIENAKLYEAALARARTAAQLSLLGVRLTASLDVAETLELICQHALDIFEVDGAYIWLAEGTDLVGAAAVGKGHEQLVGTHLSLDDPVTVAACVVREKKPLFVNSAAQAKLDPDLVKLGDCESGLGIPLFKDEQAIGSMMLVSTDDPHRFSPADLEAANLLSTHAALAIERARLFEETRHQVRQLRLVQEVGRDVTSYLDLDLLLAAVAERLWSTFGYYAVIIVVRDGDRLVPRAILRRGQNLTVGVDTPPSIEDEGLIGTAAKRGGPILTPDVSEEPLYIPTYALPDTRSELTIPLVLAGEVLGVLDVQSDRPGGLTQADLDLLQPLAAQIAISLSNAQLFQAVRDYTAELETRVNERTQRIREQQERTDAILRSVGDGVAVVNLAGQIVLTNPLVDALLRGQGRNAALGQRVEDFMRDLANETEPNMRRRLDMDGLTLEAHASKLVEAGQVQGTVIVLHDITRLQEIERLKSEFVSTVSHELRTPMANLKLYLKLLQEGKPEHQLRYIDTMQQETARLEHLINDLLDLSRLEDPHASVKTRQPVDLNELVRVVVTNHRPQAQAKRIVLQTSLDETLPPLLGNRNQLIQVLTNLVSNALAYTPEGGDVWIRSATQLTPEGGMVVITVEDSGVGISPDEQELVFDRFYRGRNADILGVPGSGLGLAIVKDIVDLHGGQISVSSAVGVGSTFSLYLPI